MRRITAELNYQIPEDASLYFSDPLAVFFEVIEAAVSRRFNDFFIKTESASRKIRVLLLLETDSSSLEESSAILSGLAEAVNKEVQQVITAKMQM